MLNFINKIFTWWNGATLGTLWYTKRHGVLVGHDLDRNKYYVNKKTGARWVIFDKLSEPTLIPTQWYAWLHFMIDNAPTDENWDDDAPSRLPNLSGTSLARAPEGSLTKGGLRKSVSADYEAWKPTPNA